MSVNVPTHAFNSSEKDFNCDDMLYYTRYEYIEDYDLDAHVSESEASTTSEGTCDEFLDDETMNIGIQTSSRQDTSTTHRQIDQNLEQQEEVSDHAISYLSTNTDDRDYPLTRTQQLDKLIIQTSHFLAKHPKPPMMPNRARRQSSRIRANETRQQIGRLNEDRGGKTEEREK